MENKQKEMLKPEIEARIDELLAKMTLLEKAGQLTQLGANIVGGFDFEAFMENPDPELMKNVQRDFHEDWIKEGTVGSYLGVQGAEEINRLQKIAVEESRLGIPLIFGLDVIHGYRTIFPTPLAEACSWEPALARETARVAAREAAAAGIHWTFAPMMDIARDARWGRIVEGSGEDPLLGSAFAAARVQGFQGDDLTDHQHVAACAKHYIAYGAAVAGRDYNSVEMSLQTLHEIYLPPFTAAVNAGVASVMSAFNDLNGVPTSANRTTLTDILRGKLGFNGLVVSDSNSIGELVAHGYAVDRKDAGKKALTAGVDMDMVTESYRFDIPELVEAGTLPVEVVNEAVRRILRVKFLLGLFESPYRSSAENESATQLRAEHVVLARESARRAMVLLKNEAAILPLKNDIKTIAVIGPLADSPQDMLGSWSFTGSAGDVVSILAGIRSATSAEVLYAAGCDIDGKKPADFSGAIAAASQADVVIAVVGESARMSGEAASRMDIGLPGHQLALLQALKATEKPLVVLLSNGRPLALPWVAQNADAILETWQLGVQAGHAVADVLFGTFNPSGKLAVTFPFAVGQSPLYYNHLSTGRPAGDFFFTSKYIDGPVGPLYPFGYGLSYTTFDYSELEIISGTDDIVVNITLQNTGTVAGEEVVQLYVCDVTASRVRPVRELKGFQKILLMPGESCQVSFDLWQHSLGFYDENMKYVVEPGKFKLWVGPDSQSGLEGEFWIGEKA
ncbi:MAG: beta-glucosidase BglX [Chloroflexota bacterium]